MSASILILYTRDPFELRNRGSVIGSYLASLAHLLHDAGYQVRINDSTFEAFFTEESAPPTPIYHRKGLRYFFARILPTYLKQWVKDLKAIQKADRITARIKTQPTADVILDFYTFGSRAGAVLAAAWKCPLYMIYDGPVSEEYAFFHGMESPMKRTVEKRQIAALNRAQGIVVYSDAMATYVTKLAGLTAPNLFVHHVVDFSRFEFCDEKPDMPPINIGFVGSFLPWHRIDLLVRAFERLMDAGYPVRLFLIGYGMEWKNIEQQIAGSRWKSYISLPGFKDRDELFSIKQQLHIGVVPSAIWYQAPMKLFEYGAMGIACIAPPTPTISYIFKPDKEEIMYFENNNEDALFSALEQLVKSPQLISRLATHMQNRIREDYGPQKSLSFFKEMMQI